MATRRTPTAALDARMETLLIAGPWAVGLDLLTAPDHDLLRALWQAHEPSLRAEAVRRGLREPWFVDRDLFVRTIEGEDAPRQRQNVIESKERAQP